MIVNMKKTLLIVLICPLFTMCDTSENNSLENSEMNLMADYTSIPPLGMKDTVKLLLSPGGGEDPYIETSYMGSEFKIVVNEEGDTSKYVTHDSTFFSPEGCHVGSYWIDIPLADQTEVKKKTGYGYFLKLYSGWTLGFCAGSECTNQELSNDSRVVWIEK